tara:strand:+ start:156 stop:608 length:453 start_codon:yes stop_codon:yes gene_type:complete
MKALFVCHGNIERSASAEIIAKQLYPHWNTRSCGVAATPGRITGKKMRTALAEKGFLPTANKEHGIRSSQITQDDVNWADRVFYMDGGNERRLFAQFGKVSHAQRLSDYVDGANTVPNPGRCNDLSQHLRIVDMIVEAFPKINQELVDNT